MLKTILITVALVTAGVAPAAAEILGEKLDWSKQRRAEELEGFRTLVSSRTAFRG